MGCVFHATNTEISFKNFVNEIGLETYRLLDKDEGNNKKRSKSFCFSCIVSEADWDNTNKQFEDMKRFINNNRSKLILLKYKIPNTDWRFDIPIYSRLNNNIIVQCEYIDSELIKLCAEFDIGIEISFYPKAKDTLWKKIVRNFA